MAGIRAEMTPPPLTRRRALQVIGAAAIGLPGVVRAQGRCLRTPQSPACSPAAIPPVFAPTGWRTTALEHITIRVRNYGKEAAFYAALMGWAPRSDDGRQAILDVGDWGSVIVAEAFTGRAASANAVVTSLCVGIEPWNAAAVEAALRARDLVPVAAHDTTGFQSFHVTDPDGLDLQISNGAFATARKRTTARVPLTAPAPFAPTGWKTVWLDHMSYSVADYKRSVSFYRNLLGWGTTYDEGSQEECLIGDVGNIIIRGGNSLTPGFSRGRGRAGGIDHLSFGIAPWDTDAVRSALAARRLHVRPDAGGGADLRTSPYKSVHTTTPGGYDLQISNVTRETRLVLSNAVRPRRG